MVLSTLDIKKPFSHMAVPKVSFNSSSQVRGVIIPWNWNTLVFTGSELFPRGTGQIKRPNKIKFWRISLTSYSPHDPSNKVCPSMAHVEDNDANLPEDASEFE